jgi:hypothetical protein
MAHLIESGSFQVPSKARYQAGDVWSPLHAASFVLLVGIAFWGTIFLILSNI